MYFYVNTYYHTSAGFWLLYISISFFEFENVGIDKRIRLYVNMLTELCKTFSIQGQLAKFWVQNLIIQQTYPCLGNKTAA